MHSCWIAVVVGVVTAVLTALLELQRQQGVAATHSCNAWHLPLLWAPLAVLLLAAAQVWEPEVLGCFDMVSRRRRQLSYFSGLL